VGHSIFLQNCHGDAIHIPNTPYNSPYYKRKALAFPDYIDASKDLSVIDNDRGLA
jgi:hypothetical protein